jgi:hypothetical protein
MLWHDSRQSLGKLGVIGQIAAPAAAPCLGSRAVLICGNSHLHASYSFIERQTNDHVAMKTASNSRKAGHVAWMESGSNQYIRLLNQEKRCSFRIFFWRLA